LSPHPVPPFPVDKLGRLIDAATEKVHAITGLHLVLGHFLGRVSRKFDNAILDNLSCELLRFRGFERSESRICHV